VVTQKSYHVKGYAEGGSYRNVRIDHWTTAVSPAQAKFQALRAKEEKLGLPKKILTLYWMSNPSVETEGPRGS